MLSDFSHYSYYSEAAPLSTVLQHFVIYYLAMFEKVPQLYLPHAPRPALMCWSEQLLFSLNCDLHGSTLLLWTFPACYLEDQKEGNKI